MTSKELREKYLKFFKDKGHKIIPSASLIPENDPSVLFTTAGMHPLVPYLLGQPHPQGKKLVNAQKCVRTNDIDEVGDPCHHTFFEMLGNWSLGDYWKKEAITYTFEFLTKELGIDPEKLSVTCFEGDKNAPKDDESANVWESLEISKERISFKGKQDNWWASPGETGPCGPDSEIFIDGIELGNNVFMEYQKNNEGKFKKLEQRNVDFGGGLERILAIINNFDDDYQTDLFLPIIKKIEEISAKKYSDHQIEFRIITDHLKTVVFLADAGIIPTNKAHGYIMRRLIRRAVLKIRKLDILNPTKLIHAICPVVVDIYKDVYFQENNSDNLTVIIESEAETFMQTLDRGLKEFNKLPDINGKIAFDLFQTYGFPWELTQELAQEKGIKINKREFEEEFKKHQALSRTASTGMFKGGLGEQSEITTKYHTATHLLHASLRQILGKSVGQKGSNITSERLRFDFSYSEKLSAEQIKQVEDLVNKIIQDNLSVTSEIMDKPKALESGALGFFLDKYGDQVTVYTVGNPSIPSGHSGSLFSREICGGPHIKNTGDLGIFKIIKEESAGAGLRRIYATLL